MKRRQFLFWVSFGIFSVGERLRIDGLDRLAAAALDDTKDPTPTHWQAANNSAWQWYERETFVDGHWMLTGITTPINRETGAPYTEKTGYLDESLVPAEMRVWDEDKSGSVATANAGPGDHQPDAARRARHGRPPSKWLRSLRANELRVWLKTIDVPEAGVSGMTYWTHLTRDHFFDADKIAGLAESEQAKLHAAAHDGY